MSNSPSESLYCDLNLIHKIITRGIRVSLENTEKYRASGFPNERTKRGFRDYVRNLVITLENHHHSEDAIAFPVYQRYAPGAPFKLLATEHHNMLTILERVETALNFLEDLSRESEGLNAMCSALSDLSKLWNPHINCDERAAFSHGIPKLVTRFLLPVVWRRQ